MMEFGQGSLFYIYDVWKLYFGPLLGISGNCEHVLFYLLVVGALCDIESMAKIVESMLALY